MEKQLYIKQILVYYDGPVLFVGQDSIDVHYICQLVTRDSESDNYLCTPLSKNRLSEFYLGNIDLRYIYQESETNDLYMLSLDSDINEGKTIDVDFELLDEVEESWLPEEGLYLNASKPTAEEEKILVRDALLKNAPVLCVSLHPPESHIESKISAPHFIQALQVFQGVMRESFRQSIKGLSKRLRKQLDTPENYQLDCYATANGSFKIYFQSAGYADLLGDFDIEKALAIFDEISSNVNNEDNFVESLHKHKGHVASYYKKLIEFVIVNNSIGYSWTRPQLGTVKSFSISKDQAIKLYAKINVIKELSTVKKEIVGHVKKIDTDRGKWTIHSEDEKKSYSGLLNEGVKISLDGITVVTKTYIFNCEERIEEDSGTGREKKLYFLNSFEEVGDNSKL